MQNIVKCVQNLTLKETGFLWKKLVIEHDNRITVGKEYVAHSMVLSGYDLVGRSEYYYEIDSDLGCRQFLHQNHFVNVSQKKIENYYNFRLSENQKKIVLLSFEKFLSQNFLDDKTKDDAIDLAYIFKNECPWSDKP